MGLPFVDSVLELIREPLDRLIPDTNARRELEHELKLKALESGLGQIDINRLEARHASLWVSGWRPFIGWVCGVALFWHFVGVDLVRWVQAVWFPAAPPPPALSGTEALVTVLLSMLGLGGLRTVEKLKGVSR